MLKHFVFFVSTLLSGICYAQTTPSAGIYLGSTRVIFDSQKSSVSIPITNGSAQVWLMRFWVSAYSAKTQMDNTTKMPFIVTPPIYLLEPGASIQLRINRVDDALPADREAIFYLNALAIPPKKAAEGEQNSLMSGLQFAVNTRIKLFYRPTALNQTAVLNTLPNKLAVTANHGELWVNNPTPYYLTFAQLQINGVPVKTNQDLMVAPFDTLKVATPVSHGMASYRTIDDFGAMTATINRKF